VAATGDLIQGRVTNLRLCGYACVRQFGNADIAAAKSSPIFASVLGQHGQLVFTGCRVTRQVELTGPHGRYEVAPRSPRIAQLGAVGIFGVTDLDVCERRGDLNAGRAVRAVATLAPFRSPSITHNVCQLN
jgi:hypothetical protein